MRVNQVVTATTAPVNAGYAFASWTGSPVTPGSGAGAGGAVGTVVMDGPKSVTANYNVAYTVTTVPEGLSVMVDGVTYTIAADVWLGSGVGSLGWGIYHRRRRRLGRRGRVMSFRVGVTDKRQFHWFTMPQASTTYTATFGKQYSLTTASNPAVGGSVTPSGVSWWNAGATTSGVTATASAGYQFTGWSGASSATANPAPGIVMDGPKALTANFGKLMGYTVTSVPAGRQVVVDGSDVYDATGVQLAAGYESYDRSDVSSVGCGGDRYVYQGWSDQGAQSHTVTAPQTATTYTVTFGTPSAIYVDQARGAASADGTQENPYRTIQEGIDYVPSGGMVLVAAGRYTENLLIGKDVTLAGSGADQTILDGSTAIVPTLQFTGVAQGSRGRVLYPGR